MKKVRKLHYFQLWKGGNSIISSCEREKTPLFPFVKGRKLHYFQLWKGENSYVSNCERETLWYLLIFNHSNSEKKWLRLIFNFSASIRGWQKIKKLPQAQKYIKWQIPPVMFLLQSYTNNVSNCYLTGLLSPPSIHLFLE